MKPLSISILSVLVIAVLLVQIYAPVVEASVIYGPSQYRGGWYRDPVSNESGPIANGSRPVVNGSGQSNVNGIPVDRKVISSLGPGDNGQSSSYAGQFTPSGNDGPALGDYKRLMCQYRPAMHFEKDGDIRLNGMKNNDDAGSSLVFKFLSKYVKTDNFTINAPHGNYTLYLRNGDGTGKLVRNGTIFYVRLNGKDVFTPLDYSLTNQVLKKKVSVSENNTLQVFAVGEPGSYMTLWLEDESPNIVITSPWDDSASNGTVLLAGYTADHGVKSVTVRQSNNNTPVSIPVTNGNFSADLPIKAPVKLNVTAMDSTGTLRSATLCLDGDHLPEKAEKQYGFDPLNPDSNSKLTAADEAGNGIVDGYEILGGQNANNTRLPAFIKAEVHADPLKDDSDNDGLTDYFEVLKLGPYADASEPDHDGNSVSDALEDADNDNLTNIEEQTYGTDPLLTDSDNDGLEDGYEVKVSHTNPLLNDSDNDGLTDDSELRLGTDANDPDENHNGILDGNEPHTYCTSNQTLGVSITITGNGDPGKELTIREETSEYYTNISALASPLVEISSNESFDSACITMQYEPSVSAANLSLCYYNESLGLYVPVPSTVDGANHMVSANVTHLSVWGVFDTNALQELYNSVASFNEECLPTAPTGELNLNGHSMSWPYDIRFTDSADTSLNYWVESYDADSAVVWVKTSSIPAAPGDAKLNVYYGKPGDSDLSNGPGTFLAFHGASDSSYADASTVGYDHIAYQTSVRRVGELGSIVYGLKSQDDSDYMYIELNGTGNRNGVAKNSETIGSVLISNGFGRLANGRYERVAVGNYSFYWDGSGRVYLSQSPTSLMSTGADDAFDITTQYGSLAFQSQGQNVYYGIPDITSICRQGLNNVTVMVRDIWGTYIGCNPVYITTCRNFIVVTEPGMPEDGVWHDLTITRDGSTAKFYYDDDQISPSVAVCLPDEPLRLYSTTGSPAEQAYAFVRKYATNEPAFNNAGTETQIPGSSGYEYKNTLDIKGSPDGAQTDYQVKVVVHRESPGQNDSDGDGLPDIVETHGFKDALGHTYYTLPNDRDSDHDGLEDGEEAGELVSSPYCASYYTVYSNPRNDDSDNDQLGDFDEIKVYFSDPFNWDSDWDLISDGIEINVIGSDPTSGDTDGDGYPDLFEYAYSDLNPSVPGFLPSEVKFDPCKPDISPEKRALEFTTGALSGEYYAQDHDNLFYLSGWMSVGFVPGISDIADVRDLFASVILKESGSNIALNGLTVIIDVASDLGYLSLIGAIPGYLASTISTEVNIGLKFLGHHPKFLGDVLSMIFIVAKLDNNIDTQVKAAIQAFDKVGINGNDFYIYLKEKGVSKTQFVTWSEKLSKDGAQKAKYFLDSGHSVEEVDYVVSHLSQNLKLEDVELIGTKTIGQKNIIYWLDNEKVTHIAERHITGLKSKATGNGFTSFWPTGNNVRPQYTTSNIMNMDDVEQMIQNSIKNGFVSYVNPRNGNMILRWELQDEQFGIKVIGTVVNKDGRIITSYPVQGSRVLVYNEATKIGSYFP